ncbi:uncharacterized protein RMCB_1047 [Mycolicibacterium brisbanense]|uniref:Uncharacterized protein n=1 Tax=Mycolicibacterium brisbanense TaxID=146020 RepID=A0A100VW33_9MYCO|nr:uncharacterized protein RMCB_1047 [Mycolicibacterium brisbanense]
MSGTGAGGFGVSDHDMRRYNADLDQMDTEASEFSWGNGLVPNGMDHLPPFEGGRYKGCQASLDDPPAANVTMSSDPRI